MPDCLALSGAPEALIPGVVGAILLITGIALVMVSRRGGRHAGAALGLALLLALSGIGVATTASAPSAVAATDECGPTPAPTEPTPVPTPTPTPTFLPVIQPDEQVTFDSGEVTFFGSYRGPRDTSGSVPAAVIIGGTGAVDRDGNGAGLQMEEYEWIADLLSAQGIASIRYDKLGTGETGLGPYASDPDALLPLTYDELRIQPARDALSFLAAQPGVDPDRLIVVGHSEGGGAAVTIAHDPGDGPAPAGLALVEPAYTHILDVISRQFAQQIDAAVTGGAMTAPDATTLKDWMYDGIDEIRSGTPPFPAPGPVPLPAATDYTALMQTTIENNVYGSDPAQMVITHAYRTLYGKGYDALDPATFAPSITVPTLITCGTKDFNTPCGDGTPGSGVRALADAFPPGVVHFAELPNMVHIMRDVGDNNVPNIADQIAYPFSSQLEREFTDFVGTFND